jgi:hypothetical protein
MLQNLKLTNVIKPLQFFILMVMMAFFGMGVGKLILKIQKLMQKG